MASGLDHTGFSVLVCLQEQLSEGLAVTTEFQATIQELLKWVGCLEESLGTLPSPSYVLETVTAQIQGQKVGSSFLPPLPGTDGVCLGLVCMSASPRPAAQDVADAVAGGIASQCGVAPLGSHFPPSH